MNCNVFSCVGRTENVWDDQLSRCNTNIKLPVLFSGPFRPQFCRRKHGGQGICLPGNCVFGKERWQAFSMGWRGEQVSFAAILEK
jgi:hypothetical protein